MEWLLFQPLPATLHHHSLFPNPCPKAKPPCPKSASPASSQPFLTNLGRIGEGVVQARHDVPHLRSGRVNGRGQRVVQQGQGCKQRGTQAPRTNSSASTCACQPAHLRKARLGEQQEGHGARAVVRHAHKVGPRVGRRVCRGDKLAAAFNHAGM